MRRENGPHSLHKDQSVSQISREGEKKGVHLMTATLSNLCSFRSISALTKWVVPMLTASALVKSTDEPALDKAILMAAWMPDVTSRVVGDLAEARTGEGWFGVTLRRTASLEESRGNSRRR